VAEIGLVEVEDIRPALGPDALQLHKGSRGHVLAIAGSPGKYGAGRLAGLAALRAGCGLVTIAASTADTSAEDPLMTAELSTPQGLNDLLLGKASVVIGPGMDTSPRGKDLVLALLGQSVVPIVMDADALNHLGDDLQQVAAAQARVVLTPHPGEAGRLLGLATAAVQADRIGAVRKLAGASKAIVVLKGARTCVCDGGTSPGEAGRPRFVAINSSGGPELSTAGTGDVLAGIVSALLARGLEPGLAARVAVYWHGEAGRFATEELGGPGLVASDLLGALPASRSLIARG
jgi:NAD(P)H-hydrate epimerase